MPRAPLGCMTCIGYNEDLRYETTDQNGARWLIYAGEFTPNLYYGYSDQYNHGGEVATTLLGPMPETALHEAIKVFATSMAGNKMAEPSNPYDTNFGMVPYKKLPFSVPANTSGGGGGPTDPKLPGSTTPPAPTEKKDYILPAAIGGVALLLFLGTLKVK